MDRCTPKQEERAHEIARELTGGRYSRTLWKSILALVVADEMPAPAPRAGSGPAPGARQVLPKSGAGRAKGRRPASSEAIAGATESAAQEGLW